ncbi:MAG: hypothetical protein LBJ67_03230 [Planctomycetaceae bacterium]|nr:hypothetical protein [Planctomycetaceae bacterium]
MSKFCPHCGEPAHDKNAVICPNTGLPLRNVPDVNSKQNKPRRWYHCTLSVPLFVIVLLLTTAWSPIGLVIGIFNLIPDLNYKPMTKGRLVMTIIVLLYALVAIGYRNIHSETIFESIVNRYFAPLLS